ncbi:hypothetical protein GW17_00004808 [Ensete ventricosum]|nr:hypothetical protein GW17_00004808 [Ensete ventricosum]
MEAPPGPLRLRCSAQNYDWGRFGEESTVARLFEGNSGSQIELGRPYAEFWMGTHESGPSFVVASPEAAVAESECLAPGVVTLKKWIGENPGALGLKVVQKWGKNLPFLFKELKDVLVGVPEITELIGNEEASKIICSKNLDGYLDTKALLRSIFTKLMSASKEAVLQLVSKVKDRLDVESKGFPEILRGVPIYSYVSRYTPPFDEFEVDRCLLPPKESVVFSAIPGPSIFVIVAGEGTMQISSPAEERKVTLGNVFFVPAQNEIRLIAGAGAPIHLYRAGVNNRVFG